MSKLKDLTGQKFGRLTVIKDSKERSHGHVVWECECECGNQTLIAAENLGRSTNSCGCLGSEVASKVNAELYVQQKKMQYVEGTYIAQLDKKINKNNTSGVKGVWWRKHDEKWQAEIFFKGEKHNLGIFEKLKDAAKARKEAEEKYFNPIIEKFKQQKSNVG